MNDMAMALRAGIVDSVGISSAAGFLFFVMFFSVVLCWRKTGILLGRQWLVGNITGHMVVNLSGIVLSMKWPWWEMFSRICYACLVVVSLILGATLLKDWVLWKRYGKFELLALNPKKLKWGRLTQAEKKSLRWNWRWRGTQLLAFVAGCIVALLQTRWPPDFAVNLLIYKISWPGQRIWGIGLLLLYVVTFVWPVWVFYIGVRYSVRNANRDGRTEAPLTGPYFPRWQMFFAAAFLAYGLGEIIIFLYPK